MYFRYILLIISILFQISFSVDEDEDADRETKVLNMFSVVRFPNDGCTSSDNRNGTCYSTDECGNRGGSASGSCASGYGVCCICKLSKYTYTLQIKLIKRLKYLNYLLQVD